MGGGGAVAETSAIVNFCRFNKNQEVIGSCKIYLLKFLNAVFSTNNRKISLVNE